MKQQTEEITIKFLGFELKAKNPGRNTRYLVLVVLSFLLAISILFTSTTKNKAEKERNSKPQKTGKFLKNIRSP